MIPEEKKEKDEGFMGGSDPIETPSIIIDTNTGEVLSPEKERALYRFIIARRRNHDADGA